MNHNQSRKIIAALFLICLLLGFERPVHAQERPNVALKFDEFGDVAYSDKIARLDNFAIQLQNEPNTRGFIIVYRTRRDAPGLSNRYAVSMKNYLVMARGLPKERVVTVDGGEIDCLRQELWIVPVGAAPAPRREAYSNSFLDPDIASKFDTHYYASAYYDDYGTGYETLDANLDAFGAALRQEPKARAYLIGYAQYYIERGATVDEAGREKPFQRVHMDTRGSILKMLRAERDYLVKSFGIAPGRIKLVDGGYRTSKQVELWIVPPEAYPPQPTPNQFPGRRKAR